MAKKIITVLLGVGLLYAPYANATFHKSENKSEKSTKGTKSLAAGCSQATASTELDINNTRALIHTGGDMWWDLVGAPRYEVPSGSGANALFAGSLWLGGRDVSGQLKVAALRFRSNGTDYWPGPLSTETGEIDPETCTEYDKHFVTLRNEVSEFASWYEAGLFDAENGTSTQAENFPDYQIPQSILEWPAHGRNFDPYNEDYYLAPFVDRNGDGAYNPLDGDYPAYDLEGQTECQQKIVNIYGDQNLWWIFNDKGNIHTESGSQAIGMEIRAQAFAFATNDEVNNMTFYNYELVNRSTFTLADTYFGQWVDADLGNAQDDFVGCDVQRGLGYCYNGDNTDEDNAGATGYGAQPPAIGVDFFQGPFQDADGLDNPLTNNYQRAVAEDGIPYGGIGIGYGDSIPDNERFGMRKFLYHNNDRTVRGDPQTGVEYYNYLRSYWRDGTRMVYGGTGHIGSTNSNVEADYMFPGNTDSLGWGTGGDPQPAWTEETAGNTPFDRRFMQSAGPFTLEPGAVNNITVGVVWARATSGGPSESVQAVRRADDKTQALFDNCFQILNGPDAPQLVIQEMDSELLIYITNPENSNNYQEAYTERDPFIIVPDSVVTGETVTDSAVEYQYRELTEGEKENYNRYRFQGYQVYQVKDKSVAVSDLNDPELARLVFQCDIRDSVSQVINYPVDEDLGIPIAEEKVDGANEGIKKSFRVTTDQFAQGNTQALVNHKAYYYIAVAYAYNNFKNYDPEDPADDAQTTPYIASRQGPAGPVVSVSAIPHKTETENGGTVLNAQYGDQVAVTRLEGIGNGGYFLEMRPEDREKALEGPLYRVQQPTYEAGNSPIGVKVVDPLNVKGGTYTVQLVDSNNSRDLADATFYVYGDGLGDTVYFDRSTIAQGKENLLLDLGISISINQAVSPGTPEAMGQGNGFIGASISFANGGQWLTGVADVDNFTPNNWILAGQSAAEDDGQTPEIESHYNDWDWYFSNGIEKHQGIDDNGIYETVLNGTWAPFRLGADHPYGPVPTIGEGQPDHNNRSELFTSDYMEGDNTLNQLRFLHSVDIVLTPDKSKWTRCPVIEMADDFGEDGTLRGRLRASPSVDKDGNYNAAGDSVASGDPADAAFIGPVGMGWFPGYAVDIETGERLNMAFGESSYLLKENGGDMLWNPTANLFEGPLGDVRMGGLHYIIVFRDNIVEDDENAQDNASTEPYNDPKNRMPAYDHGQFAFEQLSKAQGDNDTIRHYMANVYRAGMWVGLPLLAPGAELESIEEGLVPTETVIKLRANVPFRTYATGTGTVDFDRDDPPLTPGEVYYVNQGPVTHADETYYRGDYFEAVSGRFNITQASNDENGLLIPSETGGLPKYQFNLDGLAPRQNDAETAEDALDLINVVPNPYYAYSQYEEDKLDNRVRFTNLPETCNINIYTVNGTLVRGFQKDDASTTYLDWDLKNQFRTPVASGIYIVHVEVPGVGERILKWFGMMRPVDLDAF